MHPAVYPVLEHYKAGGRHAPGEFHGHVDGIVEMAEDAVIDVLSFRSRTAATLHAESVQRLIRPAEAVNGLFMPLILGDNLDLTLKLVDQLGMNEEVEQMVIKSTKLDHDSYLYRNMSMSGLAKSLGIEQIDVTDIQSLVGLVYYDKAFTSTTVASWDDENLHPEKSIFKEMLIRLNIAVPEGTNALYIDSVSHFDGREYEILLDKGMSAIITDVYEEVDEKGNSIYYIDMMFEGYR